MKLQFKDQLVVFGFSVLLSVFMYIENTLTVEEKIATVVTVFILLQAVALTLQFVVWYPEYSQKRWIEKYLPKSGMKMIESHELYRTAYNAKTWDVYKLSPAMSLICYGNEIRIFFNDLDSGNIFFDFYAQKVIPSKSIQLLLKDVNAEEVYSKIDDTLLEFLELEELKVNNKMVENAKKARNLLGL
jgi:hypothetical protein